MNEKLFSYFSEKIGSAKIDEREYAFCHPLNLEINEKGEAIVTCTVVDEEGDFYDLCWFPWADFSDNCGNPVIKKIGKYEELPVKKHRRNYILLRKEKYVMKLKNIVNNDTAEIIKKLVHGLDFRMCYVVEYLHDGSVDVRELDVVRDKKSGKIIYYKDKE